MQSKQFRYSPESVFSDIKSWCSAIGNGDVYETTACRDYAPLVRGLVGNVAIALADNKYREPLLADDIPDRVRILLEGVGLLPEKEIDRRWEMLRFMYERFAENPEHFYPTPQMMGSLDY